jgi:hypothetical protein
MTTLEERIAEAIKGAIPRWQTHMYDNDAKSAARAVIAVIPKADVSDEAIIEPYWPEMARVIAAVEIEADDSGWTLSPQQAAQIVDALRENRVDWESVVDEPLGVPCSRGGMGEGPFRLRLICCTYEDDVRVYPTWVEADAARWEWVASGEARSAVAHGPLHQRVGIIDPACQSERSGGSSCILERGHSGDHSNGAVGWIDTAPTALVSLTPSAKETPNDLVGDTSWDIYRATGRVYAEASARYETAMQGNDWIERKAAYDQLQRAGEMHAKALAGMLEPMTPDEVAAFMRSLARGWEALPTADVSDADLAEAVHGMHPVTTVRALLDAQAAAHAAELALVQAQLDLAASQPVSERLERLIESNERWVEDAQAARAEVGALRAEVSRLRNNEIDALTKAHTFRAERNSAQDELARRLSQWDDVLTAERSAHDAEVEALRAKHEEAVIELELCRSRFLMLEADRDAYKDEAERLRSWKTEATAVLTGWEAAFLALPREVREAPGNLGRSKARVTHDWIRAALKGDA